MIRINIRWFQRSKYLIPTRQKNIFPNGTRRGGGTRSSVLDDVSKLIEIRWRNRWSSVSRRIVVEPIIGNWNHESSRGWLSTIKRERMRKIRSASTSRLSSMLHTCPGTGSRTRSVSKDAPYYSFPFLSFEICTNFQRFFVDSLDAF